MARQRQAVTIKHVAADAGVSLQTVSRVINKEPNVRPSMKEKVQASIDKLGYVPSIAAQRMSGSKSYLILALNDRERTLESWRQRSGNDWVDQMLLGGMTTCAKHGYRMLIELVDTHDEHVERELQNALSSLRPDGVILTPPHSDNPRILASLEKAGLPFARIGAGSLYPGIPISMDDAGSARLATQYLIDKGHRRIGFIGGPDGYSLSVRRLDSYRATMDEAGLSSDGLVEKGDFGFETGRLAAQSLLGRADRPTAIIATSDQMSLATLDVAETMGLTIPRDLSLISFEYSPLVKLTSPALTAIDQPVAATASLAVEAIIDASRRPAGDHAVIRAEGRLVERDSVAPPAGA